MPKTGVIFVAFSGDAAAVTGPTQIVRRVPFSYLCGICTASNCISNCVASPLHIDLSAMRHVVYRDRWSAFPPLNGAAGLLSAVSSWWSLADPVRRIG